MAAMPMHVRPDVGISPTSFHHPLSFWQAAHATDIPTKCTKPVFVGTYLSHARRTVHDNSHNYCYFVCNRSCAIFLIFFGFVNDSVLSSHHASSYCPLPLSHILKPQETTISHHSFSLFSLLDLLFFNNLTRVDFIVCVHTR